MMLSSHVRTRPAVHASAKRSAQLGGRGFARLPPLRVAPVRLAPDAKPGLHVRQSYAGGASASGASTQQLESLRKELKALEEERDTAVATGERRV
ncbi:hypothetical protein CHLRE_07g333350v5 [Chlamydomonas reinhardtii]|uniref:Uncharacterized protein n=1 Tax=Chlamydomonas reinhardtii TaxID=3055 RepID=A0A2K3DK09_CHLRE|nr:uncharacterized protein CHLRE_07g333350v5 [Chlamydomonas reinhardtii]PNW80876.1 hypothetical protein CHLRE_07g333350v5 [Chlamydomonas reinhardtii]